MNFGSLMHADYGKIEAERRVTMWRTFVFASRKCYTSAAMLFIFIVIVINVKKTVVYTRVNGA